MDFIKKIIFAITQFFSRKSVLNSDGMNILKNEISRWKLSPERIMRIKGSLYYNGSHDILKRKRLAIGDNGELQEIDNLPNNRIVDNQYAKLVNQKTNYLFGQPFVVSAENKIYLENLKRIFNKRFMRTIKKAGRIMMNSGIAWLHPFYDRTGELNFKIFPGYEILPFWEDDEKTKVSLAVRVYITEEYRGNGIKADVERAEVYAPTGVYGFILDGESLNYMDDSSCNAYVNVEGKEYNWDRIPLIPIKYHEGVPLLKRVKSLQDGINVMLSDFENNMQ